MYWMNLYLPIVILGIVFWEQVGRECSRVKSTSVILSKSSVQVNPGNFSLYCDYNLTSGDIALSIEIKRKRSGEPYITIVTFYELETLLATYTPDGSDLKGRTSLTSPEPTIRRAILHFVSLQLSDEADYCCTLTVARPGEGNLQISSDIRLYFAVTEEIDKSVCIGESTSLFQNIIIDSLSKIASIYRDDEDGPIALLSLPKVEYKSDEYSTKMPFRNGTFFLLDMDVTDEAKYSARYDDGNISNWHKLNLQALVAPDTDCRPYITFVDNILNASINPDKCGKPTVSVSWLENHDVINEGKTYATLIPERKARIYHACIEGPAIRCSKTVKLSDYCTAFAINESNFPSGAFEPSLQCDGFVATIVVQCTVLILVLSDLFIHVYEILDKRKENRPVMESARDTYEDIADNLDLSTTRPTEDNIMKEVVTDSHITGGRAVTSYSEMTRGCVTISLHEQKRRRKPVPVNQEDAVLSSASSETNSEEETTYQVDATYPSRFESRDEYQSMQPIHGNVPT